MTAEKKGRSLNAFADYYDLLMPAERSRFRRKQLAMLDLAEGEKVLEVGCGTAPLAILSKMQVGEKGEVAGIDVAPRMIARARRKAEAANLAIDLLVASVDELPYPDGYFDVVISSLMFHHLPVAVKARGLSEIRRVLKNGGRLFLCDFCVPYWLTLPLMYLTLVWWEATRYQLLGRLPALIRQSGFSSVTLVRKGLFLEYWLATKG